MIGGYTRKLTDQVNYQFLLATLGLWTLSTIQYLKKNIMFWELVLFLPSGEKVVRHVVVGFHRTSCGSSDKE
jgi:hypothetical protein